MLSTSRVGAKLHKVVAALRFLVGSSIVFAIAWQVSDRILHNVFRPAEYFSYFTIITSLFTAVILGVSAAGLLRAGSDSERMLKYRLAVTSAYVIVSVVYNALLRNQPPSAADAGYIWPTPPNEILHVYAPAIVLLEWIIVSPSVRLRLKQAWLVLIFPLAWLALTIVRGLIFGWWPYWFLDPTDQGGVPQMVMYILIISAFFTLVGFGLTAINRWRARGKTA